MKIVHSHDLLPDGQEFDGQKMGVGYQNIHSVMKYNWNPRQQRGAWTYSYTFSKSSTCPVCGK